jgi:hypothetical protein
MPNSRKDWKQKQRSSYLVLFCVLLLAIPRQSSLGQVSLPRGTKFQIVSTKVLSAREAADRSPDFIGTDVVVRLRLSSVEEGFYFYTAVGDIVPVGYSIRITPRGPEWLNRIPGHSDAQTSPGIEGLNTLVPCEWRLISGHSRPAIEWEVLDSSSAAGEKHAFTAFIRRTAKDKPVEIFSDSYTVPSARVGGS